MSSYGTINSGSSAVVPNSIINGNNDNYDDSSYDGCYLQIRSRLIVCLALLLLVYYSLCLAWGVEYLQVDCEYILAEWLIVFGSTGMTMVLLAVYLNFFGHHRHNNHNGHQRLWLAIKFVSLCLLVISQLVWLSLGIEFGYNMTVYGYSLCPTFLYSIVVTVVAIVVVSLALLASISLLVTVVSLLTTLICYSV